MKKVFVSFVALFVATSAFAASSLVSSGKSGTVSRAGSLRTTPAKSETSTKSANVSASVSSGAATTSARLPLLKNMLKTSATPKTYTSDSYNNSGEVGALTRQLERLQASFEKIDSDVDKIKEDNIQFKNSMITALSDAASAKTAAYTATDDIESVVKSQTEINQKIAEIDDTIQWATNTKEKIQEALQVITKAKTDLINQISDFQYEIQTAVVDGVDEIAVQGVTDELTNRVRNQIEKEMDFGLVNDRFNQLENSLNDLSGMDWQQLGDVSKKLDEVNNMVNDISGQIAKIDTKGFYADDGKYIDFSGAYKDYIGNVNSFKNTIDGYTDKDGKWHDGLDKRVVDLDGRVTNLEKSGGGSASIDLSANNCAILEAQYQFVSQLADYYKASDVQSNLSKFYSTMNSDCKDGKVDASKYQSFWSQIQDQFKTLLTTNVDGTAQ